MNTSIDKADTSLSPHRIQRDLLMKKLKNKEKILFDYKKKCREQTKKLKKLKNEITEYMIKNKNDANRRIK